MIKRFWRFALLALFFGLTAFSLFRLLPRDWSYRSDSALKRQFAKHKREFEELVKMAQQDVHLVRIAEDFTRLDTDWSWPRKNVGISEERWNEYRRLFHRAELSDGIETEENTIFFLVSASGSVVSGWGKGLAYSPVGLTPVLNSLDEKPPGRLFDKKGHVLVFRPLQPHWYIYYEEW